MRQLAGAAVALRDAERARSAACDALLAATTDSARAEVTVRQHRALLSEASLRTSIDALPAELLLAALDAGLWELDSAVELALQTRARGPSALVCALAPRLPEAAVREALALDRTSEFTHGSPALFERLAELGHAADVLGLLRGAKAPINVSFLPRVVAALPAPLRAEALAYAASLLRAPAHDVIRFSQLFPLALVVGGPEGIALCRSLLASQPPSDPTRWFQTRLLVREGDVSAALTVAKSIGLAWHRQMALTLVAPHVEPSARPAIVDECLALLASQLQSKGAVNRRSSIEALVDLAPYWTGAIAQARAALSAQEDAAMLVRVALRGAESASRPARDALENTPRIARLLGELALSRRFDPRRAPDVARALLEAVRADGDAADWNELFACWSVTRVGCQLEAVRELSLEAQARLLEALFDEAFRTRDEGVRALRVAGLLRWLAPDDASRRSLAGRAVELARREPWALRREESLRALVAEVSDPEARARVAREVLALSGKRDALEALAGRVALLSSLPEGERALVADEGIDAALRAGKPPRLRREHAALLVAHASPPRRAMLGAFLTGATSRCLRERRPPPMLELPWYFTGDTARVDAAKLVVTCALAGPSDTRDGLVYDVARLLPEPVLKTQVDAAAARGFADLASWLRAARAAWLAEQNRGDEALALSLSITLPSARVVSLARTLTRVPPDERSPVFAEIAAVLRSLAGVQPSRFARVFASCAEPLAPLGYATELAELARLPTAPLDRAGALHALARCLAPSERGTLVAELVHAVAPLPVDKWAFSDSVLQELIAALGHFAGELPRAPLCELWGRMLPMLAAEHPAMASAQTPAGLLLALGGPSALVQCAEDAL